MAEKTHTPYTEFMKLQLRDFLEITEDVVEMSEQQKKAAK